MKRIIDGQTYNTSTATVVASWEYKDQDGYDTEAALYQTRGGAFFAVHEWKVEDKAKVYFETMSRDEVSRLVERTNNIAILNEGILQEPPEAISEVAPGATLYIRIPASLKEQSEALARGDGVSLNTWTMRCVERCAQMDRVGELLGEIIQTGLSEASGSDDACMVQHMRQMAELAAETLGWRGKDLESLSTNASVEASYGSDLHQRWPHRDEEEDADDRRARIGLLLSTQKHHDLIRNPWLQAKEAAQAQQNPKGGDKTLAPEIIPAPDHLKAHHAEALKDIAKKHRADQLAARDKTTTKGSRTMPLAETRRQAAVGLKAMINERAKK